MTERLLKIVLGVLTLSLFGLVGVAGYLLNTGQVPWAEPTFSATPSPSPTEPEFVAAMRVPVPADSACKECHKTNAIALPDVPVMGHPLEGWGKCDSCHGRAKLVSTAPGHRGIHKDACLMCHQQRPADMSVALPRPHHQYPGKDCVDCHKPGGEGPLPTAMKDRENCWVCHVSRDNQELFDDET